MASFESSEVRGYDDAPAVCGLRFFGAVSASISHELKNAIAIVSEHAGLLEDLALLAERGKPLDPERLKRTAMQITRQVQRANVLIGNLNRFAHSIDEPITTVPLSELISFLVTLAERKATMSGITLKVACREASFSVQVQPFFLLNLLWLCLKALFETIPPSSVVQVDAQEKDKDVEVRLHCQAIQPTQTSLPESLRKDAAPLLSILHAQISMDSSTGDVVLSLPKNVPEA
ncbi:MAG: hypothetical protein WHS46_01200 [Desulfosoma sp.]